MLKESFIQLISKYTDNIDLQEELWSEIVDQYSSETRHYHDLTHLENIYRELIRIKAEANDWESILFSLFYHDIIYDPSRSDNEQMSSLLSEKRMKQLLVPDEIIDHCKALILATASHALSDDHDINLFNDADLSILGQDWSTYKKYSDGIRTEYSIYPDAIYHEGRKKVLQRFLDTKSIFRTTAFISEFKNQAIENIQREIREL